MYNTLKIQLGTLSKPGSGCGGEIQSSIWNSKGARALTAREVQYAQLLSGVIVGTDR